MTAGKWCCEWPCLRVTLDKPCATSHTLPPRRPMLELLWEAKLHLCLKECVPDYQSRGHCQGKCGLSCGSLLLTQTESFRQPLSTPKARMWEGIKVSNPFFFFFPTHLISKMQNTVKIEGCFKSSLQKKFHTTQWQLTHPTAEFLSHIVQTHGFKFRDSSDSNEHMRQVESLSEDI